MRCKHAHVHTRQKKKGIAEVQDKHAAVQTLHRENKDLDVEFDATLRRYIVSVNDFVNNHAQPNNHHQANGSNGVARNGQVLYCMHIITAGMLLCRYRCSWCFMTTTLFGE